MQVESTAGFSPRKFGKFLLLERIGRGGMAEVFRAKTFGPSGFVKESAVKKILASLLDDEQFVNMFVDEARVTAYLNHDNIVQVLGLGGIAGHLVHLDGVRRGQGSARRACALCASRRAHPFKRSSSASRWRC